jgi:trimeric autotransporter adhesin
MKKRILFIATVMFTAGALVLSGCKKEDVTPPEIALNGPASVDVSLNSTYTDQGATATDDEDGDITSLIELTNPVDVNLKGSYTVTYTVSDAAGNTASATRTVNVKNDSENKAGTYAVTDVCGASTTNYTETISSSSTVNNRILTTRFANYDNTSVYMEINGSNVNIPSQTISNSGNPPATRTFNGTGSVSGNTITINYTETIGANSINCSATYTKQ